MINESYLILGLAFSVKHFIADGPAQLPYQYLNKGNLKHPGGYIHAGIHGLLTAAIFWAWGLWWLGLVDFVVHYLIDWAKVNLTKKYNWSHMEYEHDMAGPNKAYPIGLMITSNNYFIALMLDQMLHMMTYFFLIYLAFSLTT